MLVDLVFAVVIAIILTAIFLALAGRPRLGGDTLGVFLLALLVVWAVGAWITPVGPALWGGYWLSFLITGVLFLLLLAALAPPRSLNARRQPLAPSEQERSDTPVADDALIVIGAFFWILIVALIVAAIAAYV